MNDLISYFEKNDDAEAIEIALCEAEEVAINQEDEDLFVKMMPRKVKSL